MSDRRRLRFGFLEVGCKARGKCVQLRDKRQLFMDFWQDTYSEVSWQPQIYRMLAHYNPHPQDDHADWTHPPDVAIAYDYISSEMLSELDAKDKQQIFWVVNSNKKRRDMLEDILEMCDADRLHRLIVDGGRISSMAFLRGKMAEILAQRDLELCVPHGMSVYRNGDIHYFNQRYRNGTEIDAITTAYGEQAYGELLANLESQDHLQLSRLSLLARRC